MNNNNLKFVPIIVLMSITLSSCINGKNKTVQTQLRDSHTAQNSLDWQGTYSGNLPCADCDRIETDLTLTNDLRYVLMNKYINKNKQTSDTLKGTFTWQGNNVKLDGISQKERATMFKVEENQVRQLNMSGKEIIGDLAPSYVMRKNGNANVEDKRWQLVELNGKKIKGTAETHYLIFHSKDGRLEAKANCNVLLDNYKIKNELQVEIEPGISTLMACPDNVEQEFAEALHLADNLSVNNNSLTLNKARMAPLARFELVKE